MDDSNDPLISDTWLTLRNNSPQDEEDFDESAFDNVDSNLLLTDAIDTTRVSLQVDLMPTDILGINDTLFPDIQQVTMSKEDVFAEQQQLKTQANAVPLDTASGHNANTSAGAPPTAKRQCTDDNRGEHALGALTSATATMGGNESEQQEPPSTFR